LLPLTTWFLAIYLASQDRPVCPGLEAASGRQLPHGLADPSQADAAQAEREDCYRLSGTVQMDDACLGGERSGGKAGRGSENKVPFVSIGHK